MPESLFIFEVGELATVVLPGHPWHDEVVVIEDIFFEAGVDGQIIAVDRAGQRDDCECTPILHNQALVPFVDSVPVRHFDTLVIGNTAELDAFIDSLAP